jgi:hypothetical protein
VTSPPGCPYTYTWLTPKGTIAVYDHREQELYTYDEYGAFADDEGVDERLRADVADALGEKYVDLSGQQRAERDGWATDCDSTCQGVTSQYG